MNQAVQDVQVAQAKTLGARLAKRDLRIEQLISSTASPTRRASLITGDDD